MKKDYRIIASEKEEIRKRVWDEMLEKGIAKFPLPPHGRIPNFVGSERCSAYFDKIVMWKKANVVKINPDSPQRSIRLKALEEGKKLIMPTPRIREGFLLLDPDRISNSEFAKASTIKGAFRYGEKLRSLKDLRKIENVDFIVEGSVAVNFLGQRIGKGEGYGDLEFGILMELGLVERDVAIATSVHEIQILNRIFPQMSHDVGIDYIITPEKVIKVEERPQRPGGILVDLLKEEKIESIPILKEILKA